MLRGICAAVLAALLLAAANQPGLLAAETAEPPSVTVLAGTGGRGRTGVETGAQFNLPAGVFMDGNGSLYIADTYNNLIRVLDSEGKITTLAGSVAALDEYRFPKGYYRDGALNAALFNRPSGLAVDSAGRVYVADAGNHAIRLIDGENVSTYCGGAAGYANGQISGALFNAPHGIAIDGSNNLYIADTMNHCVRRISTDGIVTILAGSPGEAGYSDGFGIEGRADKWQTWVKISDNTSSREERAMFNCPMGIAVSPDGSTVYVSDTGNHRIRVIKNNRVSTLAGGIDETDDDGEPLGGFADGNGAEARFNLPIGLTLHEDALYVADSANHCIRVVSPDGGVTTAAGTGEPGAANAPGPEASFHLPAGLYARDGLLYIADTGNNQIRLFPLGSTAEVDGEEKP